jgi:phospholipid-translocating ATPase
MLHENTRVPADMILMRTHEKTGSIFIRTDQLDGETDWKLRIAIASTQKFNNDAFLFQMNAHLVAEIPRKAIYEFNGTFQMHAPIELATNAHIESLSLENTLWSNTVIASGSCIGCVIYTGTDTRAVLNANTPTSKTGILDQQLNNLSKILFIMTICLAFILTLLNGFSDYLINFFRFVLLFSSIIPISLRVNLDMGKTLYSFLIMRDKTITGTIVRNSTIPEELGRITYLFR